MSIPVLIKHDPGCKWSRFDGTVDARGNILTGSIRPGHSDAAKRLSDLYNLHKTAGAARGWLAIKLENGDSDGRIYETRAEAVFWCKHNERRYFFCTLQAPSMSVCAAESLLRYKRIMNEIEAADRDAPHGGMEVIPRLSAEDQEAQIRAVLSGRGMVAMGIRR